MQISITISITIFCKWNALLFSGDAEFAGVENAGVEISGKVMYITFPDIFTPAFCYVIDIADD